MNGPINAAAPDAVSVEGRGDLAGGLIDTNDIAPVNDAPRCLMACSLPAGSCAYRCPNTQVSR